VSAGRTPRFVRNFLEEGRNVEQAVQAYVEAVRDGSYPSSEHSFG
jgi:3-methyl-2-oxobutanoate hydroxymethyltransferase